MDQKAFRHLLKKYLDNSCSSEEKRIIDQWYELLENDPEFPSGEELATTENRLWQQIQSTTTQQEKPLLLKRRGIQRLKYGIAAGFIGILLLSGLIWLLRKNEPSGSFPVVSANRGESWVEIFNDADTVRKIFLEDSSAVVVSPGSKLGFPKNFAGSKREVYMEGEVFFDVAKDPGRPFFVYNNDLITQVLGTSFRVSSRAGQIEVAVKTGRVTVYENKARLSLNEAEQKSNGVIVTPNQKVTYYQEERHFVTAIVEQPLPVSAETPQPPTGNLLTYNDTPLYVLLKDLEKLYQLEILLENEKIKNCLFTGDLTDESLFNKLEVVCVVFDLTYEIKGTKILLKGGKDCTRI